jgi:hypothetical protein
LGLNAQDDPIGVGLGFGDRLIYALLSLDEKTPQSRPRRYAGSGSAERFGRCASWSVSWSMTNTV